MNIDNWILLALIAMAANIGKVIAANRLCKNVDSRILVFFSRLFASIVLLSLMKLTSLSIPKDTIFWKTTITTSILTAVASIMFTKSVQKGNLAFIMPMQALVPIFSLITIFILYGEAVKPIGIFFIVLNVIATGYTLYFSSSTKTINSTRFDKMAVYSLIAAAIFGVSTILDRTAISRITNGAIIYSACWNLTSAGIVFIECLRMGKLKNEKLSGIWTATAVYSLLNLAAFYFQQFAVEQSLTIKGGVVNVKAVVMIYLSAVILIDYFIFQTKTPVKALISGLAAIASAIALILTAIR